MSVKLAPRYRGRIADLSTTFFVLGFSTFLVSCIDYSRLGRFAHSTGRLDDVLIPQCITRKTVTHILFLIAIASYLVIKIIGFVARVPRLIDMYRFYTYLLKIEDVSCAGTVFS